MRLVDGAVRLHGVQGRGRLRPERVQPFDAPRVQVDERHPFLLGHGSCRLGVVLEVRTDAAVLAENPARERADEHRHGTRGARLVDVAGEVVAEARGGIRLALGPLAGHVVVAELQEHVVRAHAQRLRPVPFAPVALRAAPAARQVPEPHVAREPRREAPAPTLRVGDGRVADQHDRRRPEPCPEPGDHLLAVARRQRVPVARAVRAVGHGEQVARDTRGAQPRLEPLRLLVRHAHVGRAVQEQERRQPWPNLAERGGVAQDTARGLVPFGPAEERSQRGAQATPPVAVALEIHRGEERDDSRDPRVLLGTHGRGRHELAAGRLAHEREALRIDPEARAVRLRPADRRLDVLDLSRRAMLGREAIADGDPGDARIRERADERARGLGPVAAGPATPVHEQRRGERAKAGGNADVEAQALPAHAGVRDIGPEARRRRAADGGRRGDERCGTRRDDRLRVPAVAATENARGRQPSGLVRAEGPGP